MSPPSPVVGVQSRVVTFDEYGGQLKLTPLLVGELRPNQLLVKVHVASLNPIDYKRVDGAVKMLFPDKFPNALVGFDVAGIVEKTTSVRFSVGQRVCGRSKDPGTFADYCVLDDDVAVVVPDEMSLETAGAIPLAGQTALQALRLGGLQPGQSVLITNGCGGVGTFALQLAKHVFKAGRVVTTCSEGKIDFCKSLGADECLDYKKQKLTDLVKDGGGGKFDMIFDCASSAQDICNAKIIKDGGKIVSISALPEGDTFPRAGIPMHFLIRALLHVMSTRLRWTATPGIYQYMWMTPRRDDLHELVSYVNQGTIKPQIDTVLDGLDKYQQAFDKLRDGHAKGKILLRVASEQKKQHQDIQKQ